MKLSSIRSETKVIVVPFDSGDLKVTVRPNVYTADMADAAVAASLDPKTSVDAVIDQAQKLIVGWDLEDDAGHIIEIDDRPKLRAEVPVPVFNRVFLAIRDDQDPQTRAARS